MKPSSSVVLARRGCESQFLCNCANLMSMRNITIAVPDDVYREARIRAAERGTSVSALVGDYLRSLSERDAEFSRLEAEQRNVQGEIERFRAGDRLGRDELHDRAVR
jgi:plasmid stability protein